MKRPSPFHAVSYTHLDVYKRQAKRSRTTVEALELRGYRYAAVNKAVKKIKLASLKVTYNDGLFLAISFLVVSLSILCSTLL